MMNVKLLGGKKKPGRPNTANQPKAGERSIPKEFREELKKLTKVTFTETGKLKKYLENDKVRDAETKKRVKEIQSTPPVGMAAVRSFFEIRTEKSYLGLRRGLHASICQSK